MTAALTGLWPPVATPFRADGAIDTDRLVKHSRTLLADGAHGLAVLGTTSEANSLTPHERHAVIDAHLEAGIDASPANPGHRRLRHRRRGRRSPAMPARSALPRVLLLPPFYYKKVSDEGLFAFVARLIDRSAPRCRAIMLYHIPQWRRPAGRTNWSGG